MVCEQRDTTSRQIFAFDKEFSIDISTTCTTNEGSYWNCIIMENSPRITKIEESYHFATDWVNGNERKADIDLFTRIKWKLERNGENWKAKGEGKCKIDTRIELQERKMFKL